MTPANFTTCENRADLTVYRGADWEFPMDLIDDETGDPLDLTGLGPFVCHFKKPNNETVIVSATVTSNYDATGTITVKLTAAQTLLIHGEQVRCGIRNVHNKLYADGLLPVKTATPDPA